jgi:hypothetical protein
MLMTCLLLSLLYIIDKTQYDDDLDTIIRRWIPRDKKKTREEMQEEREAELSDEASQEIRHYYRMKKIEVEEYKRKRALLRGFVIAVAQKSS